MDNTVIEINKMLRVKDVLRMWPIGRTLLWKLTTTKKEADRIPSYRFGKAALYKLDELVYYMDNHRFVPKR